MGAYCPVPFPAGSMRFAQLSLVLLAPLALACSGADAPTAPATPEARLFRNFVEPHFAAGRYSADIGATAPIIANLDFLAWSDFRGEGHGLFRFLAETTTGSIDFTGRVICLAVDEPLKRAWVGAKIVKNNSTRPTHDGSNPIHQVGHDAWFRVADRSGEPDRTTSLGFEGSAGILTSPEYCATRPWLNDGAPLLTGNLVVH